MGVFVLGLAAGGAPDGGARRRRLYALRAEWTRPAWNASAARMGRLDATPALRRQDGQEHRFPCARRGSLLPVDARAVRGHPREAGAAACPVSLCRSAPAMPVGTIRTPGAIGPSRNAEER